MPVLALVPASVSARGSLLLHPSATTPTTTTHALIGRDARTRASPRARYAPRVQPSSGPPPAALWLLSSRKPAFDPAAIAAALGPGALVEGNHGALSVRLHGQSMRVISVGGPLPEQILDQCLPVAHLRPDQKEQLESHVAHAHIVHEGDTPGPERLVGLSQVAWAGRDDATRGGRPGDLDVPDHRDARRNDEARVRGLRSRQKAAASRSRCGSAS